MGDASQGGFQHADAAALGWPAERSKSIVAEPQRTHAGGEDRSLTTDFWRRGFGSGPRG